MKEVAVWAGSYQLVPDRFLIPLTYAEGSPQIPVGSGSTRFRLGLVLKPLQAAITSAGLRLSVAPPTLKCGNKKLLGRAVCGSMSLDFSTALPIPSKRRFGFSHYEKLYVYKIGARRAVRK